MSRKRAKPRASPDRRIALTIFVLSALALAALRFWPRPARPQILASQTENHEPSGFKPPTTYAELCQMPSNQLAKCDIALMNLLCAEGLRGAEDLNIPETLARLDGIAKGVKFETERHLYKFREHPEEFNHSEGYFRMLAMATVLTQDLGIRYSPDRKRMPWETLEPEETFFADSRDIFIHGLVRTDGTGTCSSMPVFYIAVGRRLGYPLKLVKAKAHLFVRWDEGEKSFNIEGTGEGFSSHSDDYYRGFPVSFTPEEEANERYLKSMTPLEELACFHSCRGAVLRAAKDYRKAVGAFAQAHYLDPEPVSYEALFERAEAEGYQAGALPRRAALQYAVNHLQIPPGPRQQMYIMDKIALVDSLTKTNVDDDEIERRLQVLDAQLLSDAMKKPR